MTTKQLDEMIRVVMSNGPTFSGGSLEQGTEVAEEWIGYDFSPRSAAAWMNAGFWESSKAAACRDAGMTPETAERTAEKLIEAGGHYTDGSPIYALCNRDFSTTQFIAAFNDE